MPLRMLVTGGTGYIGSHTVVELQQAGYDVLIVDDLSNSHIGVLDGIEGITGTRPAFEQFNLQERERVRRLFETHAPIAAVIHFAASKSVAESVRNPLLYYRNNLVSLVNLLEAMAAHGTGPFVFSSSCTVYGQPERLPVTEDSPLREAASPYGNTKRICEEILRDAVAAQPSLCCVALRYFNPIGAHPTAHIGELPAGVPDNLVPYVTQTAIGVRPELLIFGDDYDTPDGSCIRDFIHVVDLARAHLAALRRMLDQRTAAAFEVFNVGTGTGHSVFEVVRAFEQVSGRKLNYRIVGRRPGDIEKVWADTARANRELGWKAELGLDEMLASAWRWEQRHRAALTQPPVSCPARRRPPSAS
ncbi:MAG TPA: UDP-glucose 4-epimerase GalE [Candidatus Methanoperedens sp.]|nr:UDP-glucose 4-epimerase GalE [Candidatus Methanoperedens sp.]